MLNQKKLVLPINVLRAGKSYRIRGMFGSRYESTPLSQTACCELYCVLAMCMNAYTEAL